MSEECSSCSLQFEIDQLKAENQQLRDYIGRLERYVKELEKLIGELKEIIKRLREILREVSEIVERALRETQPIVSQRSGVKRAVWAWAKGKYELAAEIGQRMGGTN